jgi:hypothetical protein
LAWLAFLAQGSFKLIDGKLIEVDRAADAEDRNATIADHPPQPSGGDI